MRQRLAARLLLWLAFPLAFACKEQPEQPPSEALAAAARASSQLASLEPAPKSAQPVASAALAVEKALRRRALPLPALRDHAPQLAFGKGAFGQLTRDALKVFDTSDFRLLVEVPLEAPRALLALPDGALLAIGARSMLRWERDKRQPTLLPRPMLLPGAQVYADAQQADALWVFDAQPRGGTAAATPTLRLYRLKEGEVLLLPEQSLELTSPAGGVFGVTREGVWLYLTPGRGERLGPGGARLSKLALDDAALATWVFPARRLDQSLWLTESGQVTRALVSPTYKRLGSAALPGRVVAADVGDEGRLLAAVLVTEAGPRFELSLSDQELLPRARVPLPADEPTVAEDWVKAVTENQQVAVAARAALVAVGGPSRVTIFDGSGKQIFSIPSR